MWEQFVKQQNVLLASFVFAAFLTTSLLPSPSQAQEGFDIEGARAAGAWIGSPVSRETAELRQEIIIHRLTPRAFVCLEHHEDLQGLGNTLGRDCFIFDMPTDADGGNRFRLFSEPGVSNDQYFGFGQPILAPIDSVVVFARSAPDTNRPGFLGEGSGGSIVFRGDDGSMVVYAHTTNLTVDVGDRVSAGQIIGQMGNNGVSRGPHIHIGAWRDQTPLQPRFDLFSGPNEAP